MYILFIKYKDIRLIEGGIVGTLYVDIVQGD